MKAQVVRRFRDRIKRLPDGVTPLQRNLFEIIDEPEERILELVQGGFVRLIPLTESEISEIVGEALEGKDPEGIKAVISQYLEDNPLTIDLTPYLTKTDANTAFNAINSEVSSISNKVDVISSVSTSSAETLDVDTDITTHIFNGDTATWKWAPVDEETKGRKVFVNNQGTGQLTIVSNDGGEDFFFNQPESELVIMPGNAIILINEGEHWSVN